MITSKNKGLRLQPRNSKPEPRANNSNGSVRLGSSAWRKHNNCPTLSDLVFTHRSIRAPRGNYKTPLPEDLI